MMVLNWFYEIRSYITAYGQHIKARWLLSLIWVLAISAMIWFYGDTLSFGTWRPLETPKARLIAVGAAVAVWLALLLYRLVKARRAEAGLVDAVAADGKADPARAAAEDVAEVRARLREALKQLRGTLGRGSVYSLPWYALIGPPGAGKTTALTNSGLHFPLADTMGDGPLGGVGGTRHCDWWFTEEGILIDTAGRYTTQDDEQQVEKASWQGFLKLLKKHRPRQPLNGALVMIGLDDILKAEPAERLRQARAIRRRLRELDDAFRLRVPAYLVLTKADRLAGFSAFFDHLDRPAREQVWGVTFPLPEGGQGGADKNGKGELAGLFARGLDALVERLNGLLLDRLQAEPDPRRRAEIFAFPGQVALLAEPLHEVMGEIGSASRFDPAPRVRGVYFASAHQDRASLDFVSETTASQFGVTVPDLTDAEDGGTKSFFLARLLRDVVFNEASLVSTDAVRDRRRRLLRWAGAGVLAAFVALLCGSWLGDYFDQERRLADVEARLALYSAAAADIPVRDVHDADVGRVLPALDGAAGLVPPAEARRRWPLLSLPDQGPKLRAGGRDVYGRALNDLLLPRLLVAVEGDLKRGDATVSADALRVYPMLGTEARVDPAFAAAALAGDADRALPGDANAPQRADADRQVAALLSAPLTPIALDPEAIARAVAAGQVRDRMVKWEEAGGKLCRSAFEGHYPAREAAEVGTTAADFTALFGPNGRFDSFFRESLAPLVDTEARPWRWKGPRPGGAVRDGLDAFERAAAIRDAFFGGTGGALAVTFDVTPVSVAGADTVTMTLDGQQVDYSQSDRGAPRPTTLSWPNSTEAPGAGLAFRPGGTDATLERHGFWAPFHLLDAARVRTSGTGGARVAFSAGGRQATFDLHVDTAANPFDLATLHGFNCPRTL